MKLTTLAAALTLAVAQPPVINLRPTIGILTVPFNESSEPCDTIAEANNIEFTGLTSCFAAQYRQFIEMAGARTAVIKYDLPDDELDALLGSLNGVLFTGGGLDLTWNSKFLQTADKIFQKVLEFNEAGIWYPLHGTCQGMQAISILAAHNVSVLTLNAFKSERVSWPLDFTEEGLTQSRMFGTAPAYITDIFRFQNVTPNLHHDAVTPDSWFTTNLTDFYYLISTNVDKDGKEFVSTIESRQYPITGTQWHPERPSFDWTPDYGFNHHLSAVQAMQYVANYVVDNARRNNNSFANSSLEWDVSLYTHTAFAYSDALSGDQVYIFPASGTGLTHAVPCKQE